MSNFDVVVIGGGHAGCEAAYAAARHGCRTLILAIDPANIGAMSCNPAIGGVGKGHLVREIDVFGGLIGRAADAAALHYRMLNRSKGPAVHGPRVQADRVLFRRTVQSLLDSEASLSVGAGEAVSMSTRPGGLVIGLDDGSTIRTTAVVLATGTFLGGRLFRGSDRFDGGRLGERGAHPLAASIGAFGLRTRRFKTGTPPRLDGRSIDWSVLARQPSDAEPWRMSIWSPGRRRTPLFCAITRTITETHDIVRDAMPGSPLLSDILGRGPRYCPSIEDKVARFGDRDGHQVFLEPETGDGSVVYPNGISTSLDAAVQQRLVRSMPGLARAEIVVPGYAVEYGAIDARHCNAHLMVGAVPGLFLAGQVNGTTGYEEAAAQGLVAGLNAAAHARDVAPITFDRATSYVGVLIDDLTLQETSEPYRMLTGRADSRLSLRADNAEARLAATAIASGVLTEGMVATLLARRERTAAFADMLERGHTPVETHDPLLAEAQADRLYRPYVERENRQRGRRAELDRPLHVPHYARVRGLSNEMIERLEAARPATIGEASRIAGITPAAVTALLAATSVRP